MRGPILIVLFFIFIIELIEVTFIPFPLTLSVLISLVVLVEGHPILFAFIAGIIFDLLSGRVLGTSSLFFITSLTLIYIYRKKIVQRAFYYWIPILTFFIVVYNFIFYGRFILADIVVGVVIGIVMFFLVSALLGIVGKQRNLSF